MPIIDTTPAGKLISIAPDKIIVTGTPTVNEIADDGKPFTFMVPFTVALPDTRFKETAFNPEFSSKVNVLFVCWLVNTDILFGFY